MPDAHLCAVDDAAVPPDWSWCDGDAAGGWVATERSAATYGPLRQVRHRMTMMMVMMMTMMMAVMMMVMVAFKKRL